MFNNALCALLLTTTCLCGVRAEDGPFKEAKHIAKLVADDAAAGDYFGSSVSVSGSTIVVGARLDDDAGSNSGSAYVFEKDATGAWVQAKKLVAADAAADDRFGISVSVSGSTIVVGANLDDKSSTITNSGSAYVFEKNATTGTWAQAAKLVADDAEAGDTFGVSVSVSGSTIVVGADYDDVDGKVNSGSAYVWRPIRPCTCCDREMKAMDLFVVCEEVCDPH